MNEGEASTSDWTDLNQLSGHKRLVQTVARLLYEPIQILILDHLVTHVVARQRDLVTALGGLNGKYIARAMDVLHKHALVSRFDRTEYAAGSTRPVNETYFYLDYPLLIDAVKWRLWKLSRKLDHARNELDAKGYVCSVCKTAYNLSSFEYWLDDEGNLHCHRCNGILVSVSTLGDSGALRTDKMQAFQNQFKDVQALLKATEDMTFPVFDVEGWIRENIQATTLSTGQVVMEKPVLQAETSERKKQVMPVMKKDESLVNVNGTEIRIIKDTVDQQRQKARAALEKEKSTHAVPSWFLKSTLSGHLTEHGIQERNAQAQRGADTVQVSVDLDFDAHEEFYAQQQAQDEVIKDEASKPALKQDDKQVMVSVNGVLKALSAVSVEDQDRMSPEEYEAFVEASIA